MWLIKQRFVMERSPNVKIEQDDDYGLTVKYEGLYRPDESTILTAECKYIWRVYQIKHINQVDD